MRKRKLMLILSTLIIGIMTLKPTVKADSKIELTAGVTSYLNSVMLGKIEPTVVQNEPVVVEQTYVEPTIPTCRKKYSCSRFKKLGRVRYGDYTYTWYSQRVLPGGGLNIPGRHLNEYGLVVDENEYVVIASDDLPHGTVVDTPVGIQGIVYDEGAEMEILTSTAIGSQLKRQSANDYLQELYRAKRHKDKSFDFQALLDKEMEKLNERQCKTN